MRHNRWLIIFSAFLCIVLAVPTHAATTYGEPLLTSSGFSMEESKALLQKSLTIHEIDREIERLKEQQRLLDAQVEQTAEHMKNQQRIVERTRTHAEQVVRSYYMGERESIWLLLFSARNFSDAIAIIEFVHLILAQDRSAIQVYIQEYRELEASHSLLVNIAAEMQTIKLQFLKQRTQLTKLQAEIDKQLGRDEHAALLLRQEMEQLIEQWETEGLPLIKTYLSALSKAMEQLPEIIKTNKDVLIINGFHYTFQMTDIQLKDFLQSKDPLFHDFSFIFEENQVNAQGKLGDNVLTIKGHYELEEEPVNALRYYIDDLVFNHYSLPETTHQALQEQFKLTLRPNKLIPFLVATEIIIQPGWLKVMLKLNFGR